MSEGIIAKTRAIWGKRLSAADYNILVHRTDLCGVVTYLKSTQRYGRLFANVNEGQVHRGQVEQMLSKEVFEVYIKLCKFMAADKNSFCYYLVKEKEIKEILSAIMHISVKSFDEAINQLPTYLMDYFSFNLMALAQARTYGELLEVLAQTPYYKVLKPLLSGGVSETEIFEQCGIALYAYYYSWAFKAIGRSYKGKEATQLKDLFLRQADLDNILTAYRMKHYFNASDEAVFKALKPFHYRLTNVRLAEVLRAAEPDKELVKLLEKSYFKGKIQYDEDSLEVAVRKYNYNRHFKRQLNMCSNGTMALVSLMNLLEVERFNLQEIIEGIRYRLAPAEIEKPLVM